MKILLINSNPYKPAVPPIGLEYVCEAVRQAGHEVTIYDFAHQDESDVARAVARHSPEAIGLTLRNIDTGHLFNHRSYVPWLASVVQTLRGCFEGPIIVGGAGFSILPAEILHLVRADYGVVGAGEMAFPRLLDNLRNPLDVANLANLAIRDRVTGEVTTTPIERLTQFPIRPQRDTVDHPKYYDSFSGFRNHSLANIQTKRGCNKNCTYCPEPRVVGRNIIKRDPEDVVDEVRRFVHKGIRTKFFFVDSEFNVCTEHATAVCEALLRDDLRIEWTAFLTPDNTDRELIALMQRAGCREMVWSMESACDEVLEKLGKSYSASDALRVAGICDEIDQRYTFLLMFGGPGESETTVKTTWRNVQRARKALFGVVTGVRVYPATALGRQLVMEGTVESEKDLLYPHYYRADYARDVIYPVVRDLFKGCPNSIVLGPETKTQFD